VPVTPREKEYWVRERSPDPAPEWAGDFQRFQSEKAASGFHYFIGESGDVSDRMAGCDLAELEGKKKLARQVATMVSSEIANNRSGQLNVDKENPDGAGLQSYFEATLGSRSLALLSGVKNHGEYWEERDYTPSGGRKRLYQCRVLIALDELEYQATVRRTIQQAQQVAVDENARGAVKEALKRLEQRFDQAQKQSQ
jgi:hypothetical protein